MARKARKRAAGAVASGLVSLDEIRTFAFSATAREDTRPVLTCGCTEGAAVASADGFRLHVAGFADDTARRLLVPEDGLIGLTDESRAVAAGGGRYPDFAVIIPRWRESGYLRLRVHRHDLRSLVGIAEVFARDNNWSTRLTFNPDHMQIAIYARSLEKGDSCSVLDVEFEGRSAWSAGVDVAINARYLLDTLAGMRSDYVTLAISDPKKPVVLVDTVNTEAGPVELFSMIMPMSINESRGADTVDLRAIAPWGERMAFGHFPLKRNPTTVGNRKPKTRLQDAVYDPRCDISVLWPGRVDPPECDMVAPVVADPVAVPSDTDKDMRADYSGDDGAGLLGLTSGDGADRIIDPAWLRAQGDRAYWAGYTYGRLMRVKKRMANGDDTSAITHRMARLLRAAGNRWGKMSTDHRYEMSVLWHKGTEQGARSPYNNVKNASGEFHYSPLEDTRASEAHAITAPAPAPAPAPVIAHRRRIVWQKRAARMIGAHDRRARYTPPLVTPPLVTPQDDQPADVSMVAQSINADTLDVSSAINALTLDDLAGLMAARIAQAATAQVNSALDTRLRLIGREMQAARAWCIASIEQAHAEAQAGPVVARVDDLPLVCDWDKPADVCDTAINAPTFGPDWSVWGEFWEIPPSPDLEDTQPMPAVEVDPDPDDHPPAPDGGGGNGAQAATALVGPAGPGGSPAVVGAPTENAFRNAKESEGVGGRVDPERRRYLAGMLHTRANHCDNSLRWHRTFKRRSMNAALAFRRYGGRNMLKDDAWRAGDLEMRRRLNLPIAETDPAGDKPTDVSPEPIKPDTLADLAHTYFILYNHANGLELERSVLARQIPSHNVMIRLEGMNTEIPAVRAKASETLCALRATVPELAQAIEDYSEMHAQFNAVLRDCLAWINQVRFADSADNAKHDYLEAVRAVRELETAWQHERAPYWALRKLAMNARPGRWAGLFADSQPALNTIIENLIRARKDVQRRLGLRIKPDPIEKYV